MSTPERGREFAKWFISALQQLRTPWRLHGEEVETTEFPPPIIEAWSDRNERILRGVAAAMLERGDTDPDVFVSDANDVTYSYFIGDLAFNPVSGRAQEHLKRCGSNWWAGQLIVEPSVAEALIQELEQNGLRVGVQLGYVPTASDRWLRTRQERFTSYCEQGWSYPAALCGFLVFLGGMRWSVGEHAFHDDGLFSWWSACFAFGVFAGYLPKIILRPLGKLLKPRIEAMIEQRTAARLESWKRTPAKWLD